MSVSIRGMLRVVQVAAVFGFLLALVHGHGWIQIGGANGFRVPRTDALWIAPMVFVGVQVLIGMQRQVRAARLHRGIRGSRHRTFAGLALRIDLQESG